jgi:hypothetical protein
VSVISSRGFERCVCSSVYEAFAATEKTEGDYSEKLMCQNSGNICTWYTINLSSAIYCTLRISNNTAGGGNIDTFSTFMATVDGVVWFTDRT